MYSLQQAVIGFMLIFTRKTGQEVKHLVMKQFMEVRDVHDQEVLY